MSMYTEDHEMIIHSESFVDVLANVVCFNNSIVMTFLDNLTLTNTANQWGWVNGNANHTIIFLADWPNCRSGVNPQPYRINSTLLELDQFNITLFGPATSWQEGVPTFDLTLGAASAQAVAKVDPNTGQPVTTNLTRRALAESNKSSMPTHSFHKRNIFSKIWHGIKKAVSAVVNAVKTVVVDVVKTVVDIGKAIVGFVKDIFTNPKAIGKDILHSLITVGKDLFRDVAAVDHLMLTLNPLASLVHASISTTISVPVDFNFTRTLINETKKMGDQHLDLMMDCYDCGTTGSLDITTTLRISLGGFSSISYTLQPKDFSAFVNIRGKGSGRSSIALNYVHDFFLFPIPNLAFEIPEVIDLGVFYVFSAGVGVTAFNGTFEIDTGMNATIANGASATFDIFHLSQDKASGWDFDFEKRFDAQGTFGLTFNALVVNTIAVGIKLFDKFGCGGGLPLVAPLLSTAIQTDYSSAGDVCGNAPPTAQHQGGNSITNWSNNASTISNLAPGSNAPSGSLSNLEGYVPPVNVAMNATGPGGTNVGTNVPDTTGSDGSTTEGDGDTAVAKRSVAKSGLEDTFRVDSAKRHTYGDSSAGPAPEMYANVQLPPVNSSSATTTSSLSVQSNSTQLGGYSSSSSQISGYITLPGGYPAIKSSSTPSIQTSSSQNSPHNYQPAGYPVYQPPSSPLPPYPYPQHNSTQLTGSQSSASQPSVSLSLYAGYPVQSSVSPSNSSTSVQSSATRIQMGPPYPANGTQSYPGTSPQASISRPSAAMPSQSGNTSSFLGSLVSANTTKGAAVQTNGTQTYAGAPVQTNSTQTYSVPPRWTNNTQTPSSAANQTNNTLASPFVPIGTNGTQNNGNASSQNNSTQPMNATLFGGGHSTPPLIGIADSSLGRPLPPLSGENDTSTNSNSSDSMGNTTVLRYQANNPINTGTIRLKPSMAVQSSGPGAFPAIPAGALEANGSQFAGNATYKAANMLTPPSPASINTTAAQQYADQQHALFITINLCIVVAIGVGAGEGDVKVNLGIGGLTDAPSAVLVTIPKKRSTDTELSALDLARNYFEGDEHKRYIRRLSHGSPLQDHHLDKRIEYQLGYAPIVSFITLDVTFLRR